jgi:NAD(P)-dependent dehydrogenase (short-subunit alcohol dehydrogenase family)
MPAVNAVVPIALVTGASGNLGQAVIHKLISDGYYVVGTVLPNDTAILDFDTSHFEKKVADLTNEQDTNCLVSGILQQYGRIDVAVLTVGGFAMGTIAQTSAAAMQQQYQLNFTTAYNVAQPCFVQMITQQTGRIFLIGARPGLTAAYGKGMLAYALAKSLLFRLAEMMNDEAAGTNVVTSVVVPSTIDTNANRSAMPAAHFDDWVKPAAIAAVISFYCSAEANALREPVIKVYNNS